MKRRVLWPIWVLSVPESGLVSVIDVIMVPSGAIAQL